MERVGVVNDGTPPPRFSDELVGEVALPDGGDRPIVNESRIVVAGPCLYFPALTYVTCLLTRRVTRDIPRGVGSVGDVGRPRLLRRPRAGLPLAVLPAVLRDLGRAALGLRPGPVREKPASVAHLSTSELDEP